MSWIPLLCCALHVLQNENNANIPEVLGSMLGKPLFLISLMLSLKHLLLFLLIIDTLFAL